MFDSEVALVNAFMLKLTTGESTPPPEIETDLHVFPFLLNLVFAVVLFGANRLCTKTGYALGKTLLGEKGKHKQIEKFAQAFMEATFYTTGFIVGARFLIGQPFLWPAEFWWSNRGSQLSMLNLELRCFYVLYNARYSQGLVSLVFLEHKRKDFWEMVAHHVVTITLIVSSYMSDWVFVGCIIMVLFDGGDPPLHIAKMCKYASANVKGCATLADIWFAIFAIVYSVTRLGCYGYVVYSGTFPAYEILFPEFYAVNGWWATVQQAGPACNVNAVLLNVLLLLQLVWEYYILAAVYRSLVHGELEDGRSDEDTDDDRKDD